MKRVIAVWRLSSRLGWGLCNPLRLSLPPSHRRLNRPGGPVQEAGIDIPYRMATSSEIARESWKFTTTNGGTSIVIKGGG